MSHTPMSGAGAGRQFGAGPLSRVSAMVYALLVVEGLFAVTTVPGLVLLVLLDHDASNIPLAALCALPVGPALSAALYAVRVHRPDLSDLRPAPAFWRGYQINLLGVLRIWAPLLAWLTIIAVILTHPAAAGVPGWWTALLWLIAGVAALWGVNAVVITSLFAFRTRDVARLAAYFLVRTRGVTLSNACLLIVAAGVTVFFSEAVLALLGSLLAWALVQSCGPMIIKVQKEFTA